MNGVVTDTSPSQAQQRVLSARLIRRQQLRGARSSFSRARPRIRLQDAARRTNNLREGLVARLLAVRQTAPAQQPAAVLLHEIRDLRQSRDLPMPGGLTVTRCGRRSSSVRVRECA